ncbi:MAG: SUMF1/EgtB/PvdO family nonheme iron enzyme [Pseudomonadota bacterium]
MTTSTDVLPIGYQLEEYRIDSVLGHGEFGITYLAQETKLKQKVAIKEYFPKHLVVRKNRDNVWLKTKEFQENFALGLELFLHEAHTLAIFQHPNIVRVLHYFEAHDTAYMVMEYEQGQSLTSALKSGKMTTEAELMRFLPPLLSGLDAAHKAGFLHQDIRPDNIYLRDDDHSPVLLDFGAARYTLGIRSRNVNTVISPGYAPFEQYQIGKDSQGPWTDIYALGAVLYRVISGKLPIEASERVANDPLPSALQVAHKHYSKRLLQSIDWALKVSEKDRPQSVRHWAKALSLNLSSEPVLIKQINWWILAGVITVISLNVGYIFYTEQRLAQLRQQNSLELQRLQQQATARLTKAQKARKAEEECLAQLQVQTAAEEQRLFQLRQAASNSLELQQASAEVFHDRLREGGFGPQMVVIPAGRFQMGDIQGGGDKVSIKHFAIGRYEITFAEYDRFAEATDRKRPDDGGWGRCNRPVVNVSWHDATAYAKWLSDQTGRHYRLPTEAEWEYAARAGTNTKYWWGNKIGSNRANCASCGSQWDDKTTAPVGYFAPNPFGLYETVGNVWEWCADPWHSYDGIERLGDSRLLRGGSWFLSPKDCRAASRSLSQSDNRNTLIGFRVACEIDSAE